jgi:hypothetical protein
MQNNDKFTIVTKRAPDYKIYPGGVVLGGPAPDMESILMNFCLDHTAFPTYTTHSIVDGKVDVSKVDDIASVGNLEREILCGISLTVPQAKRLKDWLEHHIALIDEGSHGQH